MKKLGTAFTGFTRAERSGIFVLICLLLVLIAVRISIQFLAVSKPADPLQAGITSAWEQRQLPKTAAVTVVNTDTLIDINTADSAALVALNGIGAKLAHRILERRQQLGHFKNYDELWHVYHFAEATRKEILQKTRLITNSQ